MQVEKYKGLTRLSAQRAVWNGKVRQDWNSLSILSHGGDRAKSSCTR